MVLFGALLIHYDFLFIVFTIDEQSRGHLLGEAACKQIKISQQFCTGSNDLLLSILRRNSVSSPGTVMLLLQFVTLLPVTLFTAAAQEQIAVTR